MPSTVIADMKVCGKTNKVTATMKGDGTIDIQIESDCPNIKHYASIITNVTLDDVVNMEGSKVVNPKNRASMSAPCLTPNAVLAAAWLELGMLSKSRVGMVGSNNLVFEKE